MHFIQKPRAIKRNLSKHGRRCHSNLRRSKRSHLSQMPPPSEQTCNKHCNTIQRLFCPNNRSHLIQQPPASKQNLNKHGSMGHFILHPSKKSKSLQVASRLAASVAAGDIQFFGPLNQMPPTSEHIVSQSPAPARVIECGWLQQVSRIRKSVEVFVFFLHRQEQS